MPNYVRFKAIWRIAPFPVPPATIIGSAKPGGQKGNPTKLTPLLLRGLAQLNSPQALNYVLKDRSGWVNNNQKAEMVGFGNVAEVLDYQRGSYLLKTLRPNPDLGLPNKSNYLLVHRFTCVDFWGRIKHPGKGFDAWVYFLSTEPFWVSERSVEVFDAIPFPIWPASVPYVAPKPKRKKSEE